MKQTDYTRDDLANTVRRGKRVQEGWLIQSLEFGASSVRRDRRYCAKSEWRRRKGDSGTVFRVHRTSCSTPELISRIRNSRVKSCTSISQLAVRSWRRLRPWPVEWAIISLVAGRLLNSCHVWAGQTEPYGLVGRGHCMVSQKEAAWTSQVTLSHSTFAPSPSGRAQITHAKRREKEKQQQSEKLTYHWQIGGLWLLEM